ncbi:phospholipase-like protein [Tanacetum coccineum]
MRVFPKIENLKGEHLLVLVNKDVKFAKLDDEYVGEYMWSFFHKRDYNVVVTHWKFHLEKLASNPKYEANYVLYGFVFPLKWRKYENVIPRGVAWRNGLKFKKSNYDRFFYSENSTVNKLIPSAIEMNELWWRSSVDYFKKVTHSIPVLRSATKGSKGKSFHTRVRTEVRHEVHVRTEVSRVHSKEEVHVSAVEKKDIQERDELLKNVKEQKQMIIDLHVRLNSVEEKLKPGPSDVDHLDKNALDCGLDQQSMGGVSQYNFHADGLDHKSVEGDVGNLSKKSFVVDSPQFKVKDNEEACHSDFCLSTQQVRELINEFFYTPSVQVQDACVSELLDDVKDDVNVNSVVIEEIVKDDVNVNSLVKEDIEKDDLHVDSFVKEDIEKDDVQFDSVVKDAEQIENETLPRQ